MAQYLTEAIVLSVRNWGEADKMVTIFSRDYGKVAAIAYGCRRPQNRLAGMMQVFNQAHLTMMEGKGLDTVRQGELKQSFRKIREDLNCMAYAALINELIVEFFPERQPEPQAYDLLECVLATITSRNPRLVALAASWQILTLAGYCPQHDCCVGCAQPLADADAYFSAAGGGGICTKCQQQELPAFGAAVRAFTAQLLQLDWANLQTFSVNGRTLLQSETVLTGYITYLLGKPLKSLDFIRQIG